MGPLGYLTAVFDGNVSGRPLRQAVVEALASEPVVASVGLWRVRPKRSMASR